MIIACNKTGAVIDRLNHNKLVDSGRCGKPAHRVFQIILGNVK